MNRHPTIIPIIILDVDNGIDFTFDGLKLKGNRIKMKNLRELCRQHTNSDSCSERERLEEQIEDICRQYLNHLYQFDIKYGLRGRFTYSDYRDDRGYLNFIYCSDNTVNVIYEDSWSYGGSCKESFSIEFDEVESFDSDKEKQKAIKEMKKNLKLEVLSAERALIKAKKKLEDFSIIHQLK